MVDKTTQLQAAGTNTANQATALNAKTISATLRTKLVEKGNAEFITALAKNDFDSALIIAGFCELKPAEIHAAAISAFGLCLASYDGIANTKKIVTKYNLTVEETNDVVLSKYEEAIADKSGALAARLAKEFNLGDSKISSAALLWFEKELVSYGNVKDAKAVFDAFKLNEQQIRHIVLQALESCLQAGYRTASIPEMLKFGKFSKTEVRTVAEKAYAECFKLKNYAQAAKLAKEYSLGKEKITESTLEYFQSTLDELSGKEYREQEKSHNILDYIEETGVLTPKQIKSAAMAVYQNKFKASEYEEAARIAKKYGLGAKKVLVPAAIKAFERKMLNLGYSYIEEAARIVESYNLNLKQTRPIATKAYAVFATKREFDKAAIVAKAYKLGEDLVQRAASAEFESRISKNDFEGAFNVATEYKLGQELQHSAALRSAKGMIMRHQRSDFPDSRELERYGLTTAEVEALAFEIFETYMTSDQVDEAVYVARRFHLGEDLVEAAAKISKLKQLIRGG